MNERQLYGIPRVGGDVLSYCTKCKLELAHVVVSMMDRVPAKVICKTCKGQHNYRRLSSMTPSPSRSRSAGSTPKAPKVSVRAADLWLSKLSEKNGDPTPYSAITPFKKGEVLQHPSFGLGIVEELKTPGKMTVLFQVGEKILVCGKV